MIAALRAPYTGSIYGATYGIVMLGFPYSEDADELEEVLSDFSALSKKSLSKLVERISETGKDFDDIEAHVEVVSFWLKKSFSKVRTTIA